MANDYTWGTGRRKGAVASVRIRPGTGAIIINGKEMEEYFPRDDHQQDVREPLRLTHQQGRFDVFASAKGGGITGQSGAVRLGIARALIKLDPAMREALKPAGMLTCDSRRVERKKFGKRGARRSPQFSKR